MNPEYHPIPVVLDTSCLYPVLAARQPTRTRLVHLWTNSVIKPWTTPDTIHELREVLLENSPYTKETQADRYVRSRLNLYVPHCQSILQPPSVELKCRDPKDQKFVDLAYYVQAHYLVTQDKDLLALQGEHTQFQILEEYQFRQILVKR